MRPGQAKMLEALEDHEGDDSLVHSLTLKRPDGWYPLVTEMRLCDKFPPWLSTVSPFSPSTV